MRILPPLESTMGSIPRIKTYVHQTIQLCKCLSEHYRFVGDVAGTDDGHISDIPLGIICCLVLHWQADSLPLMPAVCHLYIFDEVFVKVFGLLFIYLFLLHGLWFLNSLTKNRTQALSSESAES